MLSSQPAGTESAGSPLLRLDDLIGQSTVVEAPQELIVGRAGNFVVGEDDQFLHRRLLHFWCSANQWMVKNVGSRVPVDIEPRSRGSFARTDLGPGAQTPLAPGASAIVFSTSERTYELHVDVYTPGVHGPRSTYTPDTATATVGKHVPNQEQLKLMQALAAPLARQPGTDDSAIPDVATVARQLGWTEKKVNSKIDYLCRSIEKSGPPMPKPYRISLARYAYEMGYLS
ncbi:hypothetical protein CFRA_08390 [Corynebacterium frankenforstense DSM 45800]|uniref:Uncharacterized protein n=1 Tax=Corynebacterium frankenforstense DSM 45800 TaxID=1437875 RepID=A0A1L7CTW8_9CORY|nr:hypothetical protein [Corynebacterium frankenforstense]APT89271.1 hypothetical protein CFRA_08390 [Corynebacterium frankenforstense DSM 45800]